MKLLNVGRASKAPVREEREDERGIMAAYQRRTAELREEGGEPAGVGCEFDVMDGR